MMIHPAATTLSSIGASNTAASQAAPQGIQPQQITTTDFMTLLAAQLKGQDPTNPVDPTTFVTQLAQFVELSQVSNIDTLLQNYFQNVASAPASAAQGGRSGTGSAPAPAAG